MKHYHNTNNKSPKLDDIIHCDGKNSSPTFVTTKNVFRQWQVPHARQNWPDCKLLHWGTRVSDLDQGKLMVGINSLQLSLIEQFRTYSGPLRTHSKYPSLNWFGTSFHSLLSEVALFFPPCSDETLKKNNLKKKVFSCCGSQFKGHSPSWPGSYNSRSLKQLVTEHEQPGSRDGWKWLVFKGLGKPPLSISATWSTHKSLLGRLNPMTVTFVDGCPMVLRVLIPWSPHCKLGFSFIQ